MASSAFLSIGKGSPPPHGAGGVGVSPGLAIFGMSPISAKLAAQRLAPVQCTTWGHPETSGFPTLDYFLSNDLMEPSDAQEHYCEKLIRLPNLSVYCEPIEPPALASERAALGMRPSACVYWCAQSLFKYLPQHDPVFPRIAREAGDCQFVFFEFPGVTDLFRVRLVRAFSQFGLRAEDYCPILPRLEPGHFLAATGLSDVFLDSIGFSGCNTTLDALVYDLPIVTLRGDLMRGRQSAAMLDMMGMAATVCELIEEYVELAVGLARDVAWRAEVKRTIAANKRAIYRDRTCIAALEEFLDQVARGVQAKYDNGTLKTRGPEMSGPFSVWQCRFASGPFDGYRSGMALYPPNLSSRACRRTARPCRASLKAASNITALGVPDNPGAPHVVRSEVHQVGPKGERDRYLAP